MSDTTTPAGESTAPAAPTDAERIAALEAAHAEMADRLALLERLAGVRRAEEA